MFTSVACWVLPSLQACPTNDTSRLRPCQGSLDLSLSSDPGHWVTGSLPCYPHSCLLSNFPHCWCVPMTLVPLVSAYASACWCQLCLLRGCQEEPCTRRIVRLAMGSRFIAMLSSWLSLRGSIPLQACPTEDISWNIHVKGTLDSVIVTDPVAPSLSASGSYAWRRRVTWHIA